MFIVCENKENLDAQPLGVVEYVTVIHLIDCHIYINDHKNYVITWEMSII